MRSSFGPPVAPEKKRGKEFLASFERHFSGICTVRIDRLEEFSAGTLAEGYKLIVEERRLYAPSIP